MGLGIMGTRLASTVLVLNFALRFLFDMGYRTVLTVPATELGMR